MNANRSGRRDAVQFSNLHAREHGLPADVVHAIERTHGVMLDGNAPAWRKHEALASLAALAFMSGRIEQVAADVASMQPATQGAGDLVTLAGESGAFRRTGVRR